MSCAIVGSQTDAARPLRARQHPDDEEDEESRNAESLRELICNDAYQKKHRYTDKYEFEGDDHLWIVFARTVL